MEKLVNFKGKKCFSLTTSGANKESYPNYFREPIEKHGGIFLGGYGTYGHGNFFPLNLFGGKNKGCPTQESIQEGKKYLETILV